MSVRKPKFVINNYDDVVVRSCLERLNCVVQGFYDASPVQEDWFEEW